MVEAFERVARARRQRVVETLRHSGGGLPAADRLLHRLVQEESGAGSMELRAVAMNALVARRQGEAVQALVRVLREDPNGDLQDYALRYLAAVGDQTAVPEALERLRTQLRRPSRDVEGRITALAYLGQHVAPATAEMTALVDSVRQHWQSVHPQLERPWLARNWPDLVAGPGRRVQRGATRRRRGAHCPRGDPGDGGGALPATGRARTRPPRACQRLLRGDRERGAAVQGGPGHDHRRGQLRRPGSRLPSGRQQR